MNFKQNYFSSKPKQITQAAINVTGRVFGDLKNVSVVTINNTEIAQTIFNNFKKKISENQIELIIQTKSSLTL